MDNYKFAEIANDSKLRERLSGFEEEISREFGKNVVLIAYSKEQDSPNPNS